MHIREKQLHSWGFEVVTLKMKMKNENRDIAHISTESRTCGVLRFERNIIKW